MTKNRDELAEIYECNACGNTEHFEFHFDGTIECMCGEQVHVTDVYTHLVDWQDSERLYFDD